MMMMMMYDRAMHNDIFNRIQIHNTDSFRTELAVSSVLRAEVTKDRSYQGPNWMS